MLKKKHEIFSQFLLSSWSMQDVCPDALLVLGQAWEWGSWMFSKISHFWRGFPAPDIRNRADPGSAVSSAVTGWVVCIWCGWRLILGLAASIFVAFVFERFCGVILNLPTFSRSLFLSLSLSCLLIVMECWPHSYSSENNFRCTNKPQTHGLHTNLNTRKAWLDYSLSPNECGKPGSVREF